MTEKIYCKCGCGLEIIPTGTRGRTREYYNADHRKRHSKELKSNEEKTGKKEEQPLCRCGCGTQIPIQPNTTGKREFIDDVHRQKFNMAKANKIRKKENMKITWQLKRAGIKTDAWKHDNKERAKKFWDIFGCFERCCLCDKTFDENMKRHGCAMHAVLKKGTEGYDVLDPDSWNIFCTNCYTNIEILHDDEYAETFKNGDEIEDIKEEDNDEIYAI